MLFESVKITNSHISTGAPSLSRKRQASLCYPYYTHFIGFRNRENVGEKPHPSVRQADCHFPQRGRQSWSAISTSPLGKVAERKRGRMRFPYAKEPSHTGWPLPGHCPLFPANSDDLALLALGGVAQRVQSAVHVPGNGDGIGIDGLDVAQAVAQHVALPAVG